MSENGSGLAGLAAATVFARPTRGTAKTVGGMAGVLGTRAGPAVLRVLIVDDNRDAADSLAVLVTIWGYDARTAYDGATAFNSAMTGPPDVVFMDIAMPGMDGWHLANMLRRQARLADTLLVAITGYADEAHRRMWARTSEHYLVKPVDPTTVERLLLRERVRRTWVAELEAKAARRHL
jgi:CheY-like chemotaxis protein